MTALLLNLLDDWNASNRFAPVDGVDILLSNVGETIVAWTIRQDNGTPSVPPHDSNALVRGASLHLRIQAGQRMWFANYPGHPSLHGVINIEVGVAVPTPSALMGDYDGPTARLKTDEFAASFYAGQQFRTFKEFGSTMNGTYTAKVNVPVNVVLREFEVIAERGSMRIEVVALGTPSGTFAETWPIFRANNMTTVPLYTGQVAITAGGAHAGGIVLDVLRAKADDNAGRASSVKVGQGGPRGILPGTYHYRFAFDKFIGTMRARWDERP